MLLPLGTLLAWWLTGGFAIDLGQPTALWNDRIFLLLHGRLFLDWPAILTNPHLGSPGRIELLAFPFTDLTQRLLQFATTLASGKVIRGANLYLLGVVAVNFGCAYLVLLAFTRRPWPAMLGGLCFVLLPYFAFRSNGHDYLAAYYAVPLAFLPLRHMAGAALPGGAMPGGALWRPSVAPLALLCCVVVATSGIYYSFFALMLWAFGGVALAWRHRSWRPLVPMALAIGATLAVLLVVMLAMRLAAGGASPGAGFPARTFDEQALYPMRVADLLAVLEPLRLAPAAAARYWTFRPPFEGLDFWPGPLLSVFALLACLFGAMPRRGGPPMSEAKEPIASLRPVLCSYLVLCLLFAAPFGLGMLFSLLVMPEIRSQNRISPYFTFAALLLCLWWWESVAAWLGRRLGRRPGLVVAGLGLAVLAGVNSLGGSRSLEWQQRTLLADPAASLEIASARAVATTAALGGMTAVLQLPVLPWPEAAPVRGFVGYNHLLPYIFSQRRSPQRWSHGMGWAAPTLAPLQLVFQVPDWPCIPAHAAHLGFDAVMLDRRAYAATAVEAWHAMLLAGGAELASDDPLRRLYRLPSRPLPCEQPFLPADQWLALAGTEWAARLLTSGWHLPEESGRWGQGDVQTITLPVLGWGADDLRLELRSWVLPNAAGRLPRVAVEMEGQPMATWDYAQPITPQDQAIIIPRAMLPAHGVVTLRFRPDLGALPASAVSGGADSRLLGLGVLALRVSRVR